MSQQKPSTKRLKALDLFCGVGGSSRGAIMAGVDVVGAVDMWDLAMATYLDNFPETKFFNGRCESLHPKSMQKEIGAIDLLLASPECTSHTCAKGASPRSEKSRATAFEVLRYSRVFKPRWIVIENVVHMRSWRRFRTWLSSLEDLGYNIRTQVLNAADFGVPQTRRRLFITADRECVPPLINPTNQSRIPVARLIESDNGFRYTPLRKKGRAKPTLVRAQRAIRSVGTHTPFLIVYYGSDGAGGWQRIDRPLRTITTVDRFGYVRPTEEGHELRMLQVPELKAAMGFPDVHEISQGTRRDRIKLIGNAVCPPVIKAVIENLTAGS
jgi:DNA (cytosine-5)-methyltransferase 1